jgi:RimJ/RimL family protein N-acetyltransferase
MFIRTERLFLRPVFAEDWRAVLAGITGPADGAAAGDETVRMLASAPWPYGEAEARAFCALADDPRWPRFAITLPAEAGALAGMIGLEDGADGPELGYWIARGQQRRGIAPEAVGAVLEVAAMLGHACVHAGHFLDNPASGKVLARAGFVETGEVRPMASAGRGGALVLARRFVRKLPAAARCGTEDAPLAA